MFKKEQKITKIELLKLISKANLKVIESHVFCGKCLNTTIIDYEDNIFINDIGDTILHGRCKKCKSPVARYIETGEQEL